MLGLERVCVFCGSSPGIDAAYASAAQALGRHLAERGTELVYGGGAVGLMGILADATMSAGGTVTGVIPRGLFSSEVPHGHLTRLHHTATMHERKALMYELSDGFIALPGGLGTLEELFETLTWAQIGLHRKPVGLLDVNGYFGGLMTFLDHAIAEAFISRANLELLVVDPDPARLLERLEAAEPRVPPRRRVEPEQI